MKKILVTGAGGQLGNCFKIAAEKYPDFHFTFATSEELDLSLFGTIRNYFSKEKFDYCINCAAYTNVEQAENHRELAFLINAEAVKNFAEVCSENDCVLIHFSTDYVFSGQKRSPYSEEDETDPINVYGASKLAGEDYIKEKCSKSFIFRTSWLYSDIGHNFFNTVCRKAKAGEKLEITTSQKGTPTNAHDLAEFVLAVIASENENFGIYHYSNLGATTWFGFAEEILKMLNSSAELEENNNFRTIAVRPAYSVMSKEKALETFQIPILQWEDSLKSLF